MKTIVPLARLNSNAEPFAVDLDNVKNLDHVVHPLTWATSMG